MHQLGKLAVIILSVLGIVITRLDESDAVSSRHPSEQPGKLTYVYWRNATKVSCQPVDTFLGI